MSFTSQTNPNSNPINITWLVLHLHLYFFYLSQHVLILSLSLSLLSCFRCLFSLLAPLSPCISCFFVLLFHCAPCLAPSLTQFDLFCIFSLCIRTLHPHKSCAFFFSFLLWLWMLYVSICLALQILCQLPITVQPIIYHVPSLPKCFTWNAPLSSTTFVFHLCWIKCLEFLSSSVLSTGVAVAAPVLSMLSL